MLASVTTVAFVDLEARSVDVQVQITKGGMNAVVGLTDLTGRARVFAQSRPQGLPEPSSQLHAARDRLPSDFLAAITARGSPAGSLGVSSLRTVLNRDKTG